MTISELIQKLEKMEKEYGDIRVNHAFKWDIEKGFELKDIYNVVYDETIDEIVLM